MSKGKVLVAALVGISLLPGATGPAQAFPKIPKIKEIKIPKLPKKIPRIPGVKPTGSSQGSQELQHEYQKEIGMLAREINTNWGSKADNDRIDREVVVYRKRVDRVASDQFSAVPKSNKQTINMQLRAHYDTLAKTTDKEITWNTQKLTDIGVPDSAYNSLAVLQTSLYGAVTLFPDNADYENSKRKVDTVMEKIGSRAGAIQTKENIAVAKARAVRMPPPTTRSKAIEDMFRRAWATGGIPYTIKKIHIRSGWGVKRNSYGRVIGKTRDAAIAAKDPESGRCNLYDFTMLVETGGYVRRSSHSTKRMACENIPK